MKQTHASAIMCEGVTLRAGELELSGILSIPDSAKGIVLFAHGSGSSRFSSRNQAVAHHLNDDGLATLLFDLLTPTEEIVDQQTRELRFDISMLAERLTSAVDWVHGDELTSGLRIGLFGSSTGAAAAMITAAERPELVAAVVSRGGRPDLASDFLAEVRAPTLLIVGGDDHVVLDLNRKAKDQMLARCRLEIVADASHLFAEPGKLEEVSRMTCQWFLKNLARPA